jgi:hypothetical protein
VSVLRSACLILVVALGAWGCESGRVGPQGEAAPAPTAKAQPAIAASTATAKRSRPTRSKKPTALKLKGGATLTIPGEAVARRKPAGLPAMVQGAHNFTLPGGRQRLMVSELDLEGKGCKERLDAEWKTMQQSRKDSDPERLKLRKTSFVEERTVAGHRVLYSEALQGTSFADAGRPFAAAASAFMCEGHNLLLIMYISDQADLAKNVRPMIDGIIGSYQVASR